jgi:FAD/FMN-containing dehydrogenase/Fe-S oxidoreductase
MAIPIHAEAPLIAPESLSARGRAARSPAAARLDPRALAAEIGRRIEGEVRFDDGDRALYATDASNYRHLPIGVAIPKTPEDVPEIIAACRAFGAPIVSRAGGTALAGQTTNVAVVIDWSKYLHHIQAIDPVARTARVQPGVICDQLAEETARFGLTYGPKPATHGHCCYGGMLGNNSCGIHAQMAGKAADNTEAMDVLLYDGTRMSVGWMSEAELRAAGDRAGREGQVYRDLRALRDRYRPLIESRYPPIPRRVSGYNLEALLPDADGRVNVARALVGSEGTCVTMLEMTVRLVPDPPERALVVLGYPDIYRAADDLVEVLASKPIGLEAVDSLLRNRVAQKHGPHSKYLPLLPDGDGYLLVEFGGDTASEARDQARALVARLGRSEASGSLRLVTDRIEQKHLWDVRESGLGATAFVPGEPDTWPGWEDSAVAPERMGVYLRALRKLFLKYGYRPSVYGHFGMGCVHCRIDFDLASAPGVRKFHAFLEDATDLVVSLGGSFSGEHGDGQARAEFLGKMFGPELLRAFAELKAIWDPEGKMNPGRIVDPPRADEDLRLGAEYAPWQPETHFKFPEDGGQLAHAALRCVGIGKCRRLDGEPGSDTMCPSFMVTREEKHTTRGRAHLLWEMLRNGPDGEGFHDEAVKESLDLCLACKGCKGDCPVNVDIATYKAEFLSHYYEDRVRPRSAYAFGLVDRWAHLASHAPGLANLATQLPVLRDVAKWLAGAARSRQIPPLAPQTFQRWFHARPARGEGRPRVVLWADTFNNYFTPDAARAAVEVLESAGFQVSVPRLHLCCGRPLYDYGFLDRAERYARRVLIALEDEIKARTPVVVLEPSCAAVFRDELRGLFPDDGQARLLAESTFLLSEFLVSPHALALGYTPPRLERRALVQGHCHHKAIMRFDAEEQVLGRMGLDAQVLASGCCGMAGSFGYEQGERHRLSLAAGERVLLPAVRSAPRDTLILADGFSCQEQIAQSTERKALHLAEAMRLALRHGPEGPSGELPERAVVQERTAAVKRSMRRAGGAVVAAVLLGAVAWQRRRRAPRLRRWLGR